MLTAAFIMCLLQFAWWCITELNSSAPEVMQNRCILSFCLNESVGCSSLNSLTAYYISVAVMSTCLWHVDVTAMCRDDRARISSAGFSKNVVVYAVGCRWNFVQGESGLQANRLSARQAASSKLYRRKLQKRLMHHKQQLLDLQQAKKHFFTSQV